MYLCMYVYVYVEAKIGIVGGKKPLENCDTIRNTEICLINKENITQTRRKKIHMFF